MTTAVDDRESLVSELENGEIKEILKSGTDLRQYAQEIDKEFKTVENQSIQGKNNFNEIGYFHNFKL